MHVDKIRVTLKTTKFFFNATIKNVFLYKKLDCTKIQNYPKYYRITKL